MGNALTAHRLQRWTLVITVITAIIKVVMNLALVPRLGITGASMAALLAYAAGSLLLLSARQTQAYVTPMFRATLIPALVSLVVTVVVAWLDLELIQSGLDVGALYGLGGQSC